MKTLKEYADFLYANGYKEHFSPFTFLDGRLVDVEFTKNGFNLNLNVEETEEFQKYIDSLEIGIEYEIDYQNYTVKSAFLESPICNVSDFLTGKTEGIQLVLEPTLYNHHTLDLFELCIGFQNINLLEHELFIMSRRLEQLDWANKNLIPILEKHDYIITYNTFFDTNSDSRTNSNPRIDFTHKNREIIVIEIDCLTGKPIIWTTDLTETINLTEKIYGKDGSEVKDILLNEVWRKNEAKYGYIYNNDLHETVDTYNEVCELEYALQYKQKDNKINFEIIPERYNWLKEKYNKVFGELT